MGKASRWFRSLLGAKKSSDSSEKKKWASARSSNSNDQNIGGSKGSYAEAPSSGLYVESSIDANKHAIAVAAATAAVAEAAIAAAHAAAEVVKLTSGGGSRPTTAGGSGTDRRQELAAVKIQSAFRTYLARRALRALKGLVRLQALVRGHIVRKQSADVLRRMQAMARIQARASANRSHSHPPQSCKYRHPLQCLATAKKCNSQLAVFGSSKTDRSPILKSSQPNIKTTSHVDLGSKWLELRWMKESSWNSSQGDITSLKTGPANDERSDKILEVDSWKPRLNPKRGGEIFRTTQHVKALPLRSLNFPIQEDQEAVGTSEKNNSPQVIVSSAASSRPGSRGGPFTPAKSECSRSFFSDYPGYYPNYMANTESSRAKMRSQSAPRTRMQVSRRMFDHGFRDADTLSERAWTLHSNFSTKACPGSGRLDIPVAAAVRGKSTNSNNSSYGTGK